MDLGYKDHLAEELEQVKAHMHAAFDVKGRLMREVAEYVAETHGKLLRPAMVCLAAQAFGYDGKDGHHARLGTAIELFHVATLLHDDVIDKASIRRGRPTVNAKWGDDVAILMADYLYATSFDFALQVLDPEIVNVLSRTTQKMTEGEMFQIERRAEWLSVDDYFEIIQSKTAYLFSASTGLGAMVARADAEAVRRMFEFGLNFGMAFQITDDALDYEAQGEQWGKRVGADLAEGKQTLPLLHTLQEAEPGDRAALEAVLNDGRDFNVVHGFVKKYRGIDAALEIAGDYTRRALALLDDVDDSKALQLMKQIADGVIVRQY